MMLCNKTLGFIGAGAMAEAILAGLVKQPSMSRERISIINRQNHNRLAQLANKYELLFDQCDAEKVLAADIVILAVKPKDVLSALREWSNKFHRGQLIISVVAGIQLRFIENLVGNGVPVIRAMPNTSAAVACSATAISAGTWAKRQDLEIAKMIFSTVGTVTTVDEDLLDAVTGLSGSGPAYVYYMVEGLIAAGIKAGLTEDDARKLTLQTVFGAAQMLMETGEDAGELRRSVTSPGGTTMAGLKTLNQYQFIEAIEQTVLAAKKRSKEMGEEFTANLRKI